MRLGARDSVRDRLLSGAARALIPGRHREVLVATEDERGRGDLRQPAAEIHVAHGLARRGEDLEPVRVAEDLLDRVDRGDAFRRLEERPRERLPGDQLGEDPAARPVGVERCDVDPVLEDEPAGDAEPRGRAVDHDGRRALRVLAGEHDRDHPAHRRAVNVRLGDVERVEQAGDVVRPHLHVVVLDRPVRPAVAAHVEVDDPEALRELRCRGREVEVPESRPVDLHDGLALTRDLVPEVDAVDLRCSLHVAPPRRSRPSIACCPNSVEEPAAQAWGKEHDPGQSPLMCLIWGPRPRAAVSDSLARPRPKGARCPAA